MAIVDIPGNPGERINAAILPDVDWILRTFKVRVTDGYATSGHAPNGEHPTGHALDIVPDQRRGGNWDDVDRLVRFARQHPDVFAWIGYDGVPNHGRGHHLHLSWNGPRRGKPLKLYTQKAGITTTSNLGGGLGTSGTASVGTSGGGGGFGDGLTGAAIGLAAGPAGLAVGGLTGALGLADDAAGLAGSAVGAGADVAGGLAGSIVSAVWDAISGEVAKAALFLALIAAGLALLGVGITRATGARVDPSRLPFSRPSPEPA